ncbi:MAG: DUF1638 domain-containing protein [Oscillospiraceae bacterium]
MDNKQYMMLACPTLRREITAVMADEGLHYPVFYVPEELHLVPEKLKSFLCDFIPRLVNVDYLLLPMGQCGNGTLGIPSGNTTLVLPRCEDCINLLLSEEHLSEVTRPKYSYFFTDSWLDSKRSIIVEYEVAVKKYGQEIADRIMRSMYAHYKQFCYVDSGYGDYSACSARLKPLAETADMDIQRLNAPFGVLRKMLSLNFDEDFILVPPGHQVDFDMFMP